MHIAGLLDWAPSTHDLDPVPFTYWRYRYWIRVQAPGKRVRRQHRFIVAAFIVKRSP